MSDYDSIWMNPRQGKEFIDELLARHLPKPIGSLFGINFYTSSAIPRDTVICTNGRGIVKIIKIERREEV